MSEIAKCNGYYSFFNYSKEKQGYSGVATYVKTEYCPFKVDLEVVGLNDGEGVWKKPFLLPIKIHFE